MRSRLCTESGLSRDLFADPHLDEHRAQERPPAIFHFTYGADLYPALSHQAPFQVRFVIHYVIQEFELTSVTALTCTNFARVDSVASMQERRFALRPRFTTSVQCTILISTPAIY